MHRINPLKSKNYQLYNPNSKKLSQNFGAGNHGSLKTSVSPRQNTTQSSTSIKKLMSSNLLGVKDWET